MRKLNKTTLRRIFDAAKSACVLISCEFNTWYTAQTGAYESDDNCELYHLSNYYRALYGASQYDGKFELLLRNPCEHQQTGKMILLLDFTLNDIRWYGFQNNNHFVEPFDIFLSAKMNAHEENQLQEFNSINQSNRKYDMVCRAYVFKLRFKEKKKKWSSQQLMRIHCTFDWMYKCVFICTSIQISIQKYLLYVVIILLLFQCFVLALFVDDARNAFNSAFRCSQMYYVTFFVWPYIKFMNRARKRAMSKRMQEK